MSRIVMGDDKWRPFKLKKAFNKTNITGNHPQNILKIKAWDEKESLRIKSGYDEVAYHTFATHTPHPRRTNAV